MGLSGAVQPGERRIVGVTPLLHGLVHGNILAIPVFLDRAWRSEFGADDVTLGLLAGFMLQGGAATVLFPILGAASRRRACAVSSRPKSPERGCPRTKRGPTSGARGLALG